MKRHRDITGTPTYLSSSRRPKRASAGDSPGFGAALSVYLFIGTLSQSTLSEVVGTSFALLALLGFLAIAGVSALAGRIELPSLGAIMVLGATLAVWAVGFFSHGRWDLLPAIVIAVFAGGVRLDRIARIYAWSVGAAVLLVVTAGTLGLIPVRTEWRADGSERLSFGFSAANVLAGLVLTVLLAYIFALWPKIRFRDYLIVIGVAAATVRLMDSRTSAALVVLAGLIALAARSRHPRPARLRRVAEAAIVVAPLVSLLVALTFSVGSRHMAYMDHAVSGRASLLAGFFERYGFSVLGQPVVRISAREGARSLLDSPMILDNAYGSMFIEFGAIWIAVLSIAIWAALRKAPPEKVAPLSMCVIIFALFGLFELNMLRAVNNFTIVMAAAVLLPVATGEKNRSARRGSPGGGDMLRPLPHPVPERLGT